MKRILLAILAAALIAPATPAQGRKKLNLEIDLASFRLDDERNYIEVYYSIHRNQLSFAKVEGGYDASALFRTELGERGGNGPAIRVWRVPVQVVDTAGIANQSLVGKISYQLSPGRYNLAMIATDDRDRSASDTIRISFEVTKYSQSQPSFSGIELCSSLRQIERDTANIFYKNTLEAVPNPSLVYSPTAPVLYYYTELYNAPEDKYVLRAEIINSYGKTVVEKRKIKAGMKRGDHSVPGVVEFGAIPVHTLPSNFYTLAITLQDTAWRSITSQSKKFYIYNPGVMQDSTMYIARPSEQISPEFAEMAEDQLDKEFAQARYIAERREEQQWKELRGTEAKKRFLTQFWFRRDSDPTTPLNEDREQYEERVHYANQEFRTAYREGWQTDRGRVYILFGKPDGIERYASEADTKPYQIWTYDNIEGGVQFVFVDRFGFNNYELVHSTKRDELHDEQWQRFIKTTN